MKGKSRMTGRSNPAAPLVFHPLTSARWDDLVDLFGPERGANAGCWCIWPRVRAKDFSAMGREQRRDAFHQIVERGPPPGLLAYASGKPVGWVAIGPRGSVLRFDISKVSRPVDESAEPAALARTWAITCFYVRSGHRGEGMMGALVRAAVDHARRHGAVAVEVCAIEPDKPLAWGEGFVGVASVFRPLGFVEVARRSPKRPLLRLELGVTAR
jgi:GNAT superfamily N-acetyltransferase